jgi:hypothetical protein
MVGEDREEGKAAHGRGDDLRSFQRISAVEERRPRIMAVTLTTVSNQYTLLALPSTHTVNVMAVDELESQVWQGGRRVSDGAC